MKRPLLIAIALFVPSFVSAAQTPDFTGVWGMDHGPSGPSQDFVIVERPNDTLEIGLPYFIGPKDKRKILLTRTGANTFTSAKGQFAQADLMLVRSGFVHLHITKNDRQGVIRFDSELMRR